MKFLRLITVFATVVSSWITVSAQDFVRGTVVDKDGNPIPGTRITTKKSGPLSVTSLDGKFEISAEDLKSDKLIFNCAGMNQRTQRWKGEEMQVKLDQSNFWTRNPEKVHYFIMPQVLLRPSAELVIPGGMFGVAKKFGGYVKFNFMPLDNTYKQDPKDDMWYTGETSIDGSAVLTLGAMFRLGDPLYLYLGPGFGLFQIGYHVQSAQPSPVGGNQWSLAFDGGLIFRFWYLSISGGATVLCSTDMKSWCTVVPTVGLGVSF